MKYFVYVLQNKEGRYYVGSTKDIVRRLSEHKRGQSTYTRDKGPWRLVYKEEYDSSTIAKRRESEIKKKKRKTYIDWLINKNFGSVV
jgi:putative endonuclease